MTTRSLVFARDAMAIPRCVPPRFMNSPRRTRQLNKSTRLAVSTIFALPDHMLSKEEQQVMAMMNVYYNDIVHIILSTTSYLHHLSDGCSVARGGCATDLLKNDTRHHAYPVHITPIMPRAVDVQYLSLCMHGRERCSSIIKLCYIVETNVQYYLRSQ